MKCAVCGRKAAVEVRRQGRAFCPEHYLEWFEHQVERAIRRHRMLKKDDRVLVAVSGGKDSIALWEVLRRLGFHTTGLHIQLGIADYSKRALEATRRFAEERGLPLIVVDLKETYRLTIPELAELTRRRTCSVCGLSKRYVMNRVAVEEGFDAVATGHNLDDEASVLLGNVLHWQADALVRQGPVLPAREKLAKRVKPLYLLTEREILAYTLLRRLPYQHEECPFAAGAKSLLYKEALNKLETAMPGTKQTFLEQYLKKIEPVLQKGLSAEELELKECERCGYPTTGEICAFCKTWDHAYRWAKRKGRIPGEVRFEAEPLLTFIPEGKGGGDARPAPSQEPAG